VEEQGPGGLPTYTPQAMSEPDLQTSEIQLDTTEYVATEAPIPPENPIATLQSDAMRA